jgi:Tfp pilus assembly protein PilN
MAKKQKQEQLQARVAIMQKEADAMILDQGLVQTNTRLAASLQARIDLLDTLGRVVVQQGERFSATLVALARQRIDDLWLTRIELNASGQGLTLEGLTPRSQAVPQYLQRLREEASFRGRTFNLFHLSDENKEGSPVMSFVLRSEVADHFQPFEMSSDPQERPLISPQAEQDLLQQMRGVKP